MSSPARAPARARSRILLAALATLLALAAAEALVRAAGLGPMFGQLIAVREVPTRTVRGVALWDGKYRRYEAADVIRFAAAGEAFKIVGLGDSIMYGVWLPAAETYLEQARQMLAGRSARPVEVLNLAVPGYNTLQEEVTFAELGERLRPDLVLVHYWVDDVHQYRVVGGYVVDFGDISEDGHLVARTLPLPARLNDFLLVHPRLYALATQAAVAAGRGRRSSDWTRVAQPLAAIRQRALQSGARVVVLASAELDGDTPAPIADLARLRELGASLGVEVVDLAEWLRGTESARIRIDGWHLNAAGHRLIAERLVDYLLRHDLRT